MRLRSRGRSWTSLRLTNSRRLDPRPPEAYARGTRSLGDGSGDGSGTKATEPEATEGAGCNQDLPLPADRDDWRRRAPDSLDPDRSRRRRLPADIDQRLLLHAGPSDLRRQHVLSGP